MDTEEASADQVSDADYHRLAEMRHGLRRFQHWSEEQARAAGLTPTQHQLLLGIRAWPEPEGPTVGAIADFLFIRHHSAVELVDRAARADLVVRHRDAETPSRVRLSLTPTGERVIASLSEIHLRELRELGPTMSALWDTVAQLAPDAAPGTTG